jgi:CDP-diacylglycerol---glycerol-3-phosphate 3-phosphatidyltransferase
MVTNWARKWGATVIQPIALFLARLGLTPNTITILGFLMTAAVAVVLATGRTQLAGVLLIGTLAFDAVDGTLARLMGTTSRFGAFLDSTLDRWAEVVIYAALVWVFLKSGQDNGVLLAVAALATSLMVSYTRARAEGAGFQCKEGLLTRFERIVILIAGLIFNQIIWALAIIAILAGFTAVQRIWGTWQAARTAA